MLQKELENLGLDEKEVQVYLSLLEIGEANIAKICNKSGVKRTTVYSAIEALKEKGLVSSTTRKQSILYIAEDPRKLEQKLNEKMISLKNILPELLSISNFIDKKPKIRYFEGIEGIKEAYRDTLNYPDRETLAWASPDAVKFFESDWLWKTYLPQRIEKKIWQRVIAPDNPEIRAFTAEDQKHLRRTKYIPKDKIPFEVEINLYGEQKIAIMSFEEKLSLIIESNKIYNTLKNIFEIMWEGLPEK
jgi:HTH-type transcriptional regulator, sugar sensing transcriptional regulator